jgi:hypothetical protein
LSPSCDGESVTLEEPYEMASPHRGIARDFLSDALRRTAIRWALATFNAIYAIYIDFPSTGVLDTPNVSTPVRVLEFGFDRT